MTMRTFFFVILLTVCALSRPAAQAGKPLEIYFIDVEGGQVYDNYVKARAAGRHLLAKPGVKIPLNDLDMTIVASGGDKLARPLAGAGTPTPACAAERRIG